MIDTDKYGDMTMKDITAPIDEETCESPQIPARWKVKLCWTGAYTVVDDSEVICSLTGNKDSANRKEWAELIADAPLLLEEVKRLREENRFLVFYFRRMRDGGLTDEDWRDINELIGGEEE